MSVERIGRYEIRGELGEGGMATVLHGFDPRFKRDVAIKVLPRGMVNQPILRERFQREAETIATLEHHAIVPVYDYGEENGQPYLVMRQMIGGSLAAMIQRGAMPLDNVARIVDRVASALDKAHIKGVIHRDVKPNNILFDEDGNPYLSDFGIVKLAEATAQLTGRGMVGTPEYMAPEMTKQGNLTKLVDVYALGITVYQMLSGELPYQADSIAAIFVAHISNPIPDIRDLRPDLPNEVQAVIERALAKDPTQRYQSAGELAAALQRITRAAAPAYAPAPEDARTQDITMPPPAERKPDPIPMPQPAQRKSAAGWLIGGCAGLIALIGVVALALLLGSIVLRAGSEGADSTATPSPTATSTIESTDTATPAATDEPTPIPIPFGLPGNPVTQNDQWPPTVREFNGVEMAMVPAGCFQMGSNDGEAIEKPVHEVCFEQPFWIDVYEVTNEQFDQLGGQAAKKSYRIGGKQPRETITWREADDFCALRDARLPTEAEWEYTARGIDGLEFPWGNEFAEPNAVWNTSSTTAVGMRPAGKSWVGAHDMSGNVWEWVNDFYGKYSEGTQVNPQGPETGQFRMLRGGSWDVTFSDYLRGANRYWYSPSLSFTFAGVRCARDWSPAE